MRPPRVITTTERSPVQAQEHIAPENVPPFRREMLMKRQPAQTTTEKLEVLREQLQSPVVPSRVDSPVMTGQSWNATVIPVNQVRDMTMTMKPAETIWSRGLIKLTKRSSKSSQSGQDPKPRIPFWRRKAPRNPSKYGQPSRLPSIQEYPYAESPPELPVIPELPSLDDPAQLQSTVRSESGDSQRQTSLGDSVRQPGTQGTIIGISSLAAIYQGDAAYDDLDGDLIQVDRPRQPPSHGGRSPAQGDAMTEPVRGNSQERLSPSRTAPAGSTQIPYHGPNPTEQEPSDPNDQDASDPNDQDPPEPDDQDPLYPNNQDRRNRTQQYVEQTYNLRLPGMSKMPDRIVILELDHLGEATRGFARFRQPIENWDNIEDLLRRLQDFGPLRSYRLLVERGMLCVTFEYENAIDLCMAIKESPFNFNDNRLQVEIGMKYFEGQRRKMALINKYTWKPVPAFHPEQDFESGSRIGISRSKYPQLLRSYTRHALDTIMQPHFIRPDPSNMAPHIQVDGPSSSSDTLLGGTREPRSLLGKLRGICRDGLSKLRKLRKGSATSD